MVSFWGCKWQEMLESVSILTFAFPSSAPLTFCHCPVSDGCGRRYLHPFLCRVSLGNRSFSCVLCGDSEVPCVPPASPVSMQQGPELFLPFCKFLPPGVKGDTVPWWLAASGSSSVHSSFSVVENNDSRAIQKHSPWGEGPSTPAELCALSPDPPGTARWPWDGGAGCPLCPWAGWSWEVGSKQRAGAQGKQGDRTAAGCSQSGASFCNGSENVSAGRRGAWLDMQAKCSFPLQDPGSLLHSLSS